MCRVHHNLASLSAGMTCAFEYQVQGHDGYSTVGYLDELSHNSMLLYLEEVKSLDCFPLSLYAFGDICQLFVVPILFSLLCWYSPPQPFFSNRPTEEGPYSKEFCTHSHTHTHTLREGRGLDRDTKKRKWYAIYSYLLSDAFLQVKACLVWSELQLMLLRKFWRVDIL